MKNHYDYVIVGCGLFGATFANIALKHNKTVLIVDKRNEIGGNVATSLIEGINVHKYGAHIFHTSYQRVWDYVNQFANFNNYINTVIARYKDEQYHLPFNMNTFHELWGVSSEEEAKRIIDEQSAKYRTHEPRNLEEKALSLVGEDIYYKLIKGYSEKQWGRKASELPAFIISRIPLRFEYNNNYFNDVYQGIPIGGYTNMVKNMIKGADLLLGTTFKEFISDHMGVADKIIYTGPIDEYFSYCLGKLEYRTLRFEHELLNQKDYQGNAVVNYTEYEIPYTRIIEHKYFDYHDQEKTYITREYPKEYESGDEPYYPINNERNELLVNKYKELAKMENNIYFKGRLGEYKYYDMDDVILSALEFADTLFGDKAR